MGEIDHTSQWFRMTERPPARDLRGGKASEDSFIISASNFVVAYVEDFQFDLLSAIALDQTTGSGGSGVSVCPGSAVDCVGSEMTMSALRGGMVKRISPSATIHIPLDPWFSGVKRADVGKIEDPILRSGSDCGEVPRSTRPPSMEFATLRALLRARRCLNGRQKNS